MDLPAVIVIVIVESRPSIVGGRWRNGGKKDTTTNRRNWREKLHAEIMTTRLGASLADDVDVDVDWLLVPSAADGLFR